MMICISIINFLPVRCPGANTSRNYIGHPWQLAERGGIISWRLFPIWK